jgi:nitroimidazol reductase NimA-like FMN-containing flavoprotein (pyridoxamine 5'-phosphate oxidase superfamily)
MTMSQNKTDKEILTEEECWDLLRSTSVGRLAVDVAGRPDVFPINYVVAVGKASDSGGSCIVFRTQPGTKLAGASLMRYVAFEIDGFDQVTHSVWSVVVKGYAGRIEHMQALYDARDLPLYPWVVSSMPDFVRITADRVTGRRFYIASDAKVDGSVGVSVRLS